MYKRLIYIISSLLILIVSIVIVLFTFVFTNDEEIKAPLRVYAEDITMFVGTNIKDFYRVSNENAEITFDVEKDNIILVNKTEIVGLKVGETKVTINAKIDGEEAKDTFIVSVYNEGIICNIEAKEFCTTDENVINMTSNVCRVNFKFYDKENKLITTGFEFDKPDGLRIIHNISDYTIVAENDCKFTIVLKNYKYKIDIYIKHV